MMIRNTKPGTKNPEIQADLSTVFKTPKAYLNGERKILKDARSKDWWLNVDYLISEVAA